VTSPGLTEAPLLERLKRRPWGRVPGLHAVVLHGSLLRGGARGPRDVDLVVFAEPGLEDEAALGAAELAEEAAGLEADVYVVSDPGDADCVLVLEALSRGVVLYADERGREMIVRVAEICSDYLEMKRRLRYTETLVEAVRRRAAREAPRENL